MATHWRFLGSTEDVTFTLKWLSPKIHLREGCTLCYSCWLLSNQAMLQQAKQADDESPASSCGWYALSQARLQHLKRRESAAVLVLLGQQEVGAQKPVSFAFTLKPSLSGWESKCSPPAGASAALGDMPSPLCCRCSHSLFIWSAQRQNDQRWHKGGESEAKPGVSHQQL